MSWAQVRISEAVKFCLFSKGDLFFPSNSTDSVTGLLMHPLLTIPSMHFFPPFLLLFRSQISLADSASTLPKQDNWEMALKRSKVILVT